jgi:hypothetical protein
MGKIVWLASYPKSGTTWLRAFLHNFLRQPAEPYDINRLADFSATDADAALYRHYDPRPASQYSLAEVQHLRPLVHRDLTQAFPDLVFVKTHNAMLKLLDVPLMTPELTAGAVYLIRDPRDVALSYSRHLGIGIDAAIEFMANPDAGTGGDDAHVYERLSSWSGHVQSWTKRPNPRLLILRYEELLANPTEGFGRLIRFLGAAPPADKLDRAIRFSGFDVLQAQEAATGFKERPQSAERFFNEGRSGGWRNALSSAQAARIERDHAAQMQRWGYLA